MPRPVKHVGVDLNDSTGAVTTDGAMLAMPKTSPRETRKLATLRNDLARRKKGSANRRKAFKALAAFQARLRRRRMDAAHKVARRLADDASHIAFEALKLKNMTAAARGTSENLGHKVRQGAGLNAGILDSAPGTIKPFTKYKLTWFGWAASAPRSIRPLRRKTCNSCRGHPTDDPATAHIPHGRISRDRFVCPLCGFEAHADVNAARNILALGRRQWAAEPTAGGAPAAACGGLRGKRAREARKKSRKAALAA